MTGRLSGTHLVLVGPTASGKSALAVGLALRRIAQGQPTEIVSCDSMAVYRGMDIGTATPTEAEQCGVRHHLLDVVDPAEEFSVARFVALVDAALDGIEGRGASAILVGGTGLYVRAVVDRFELPGRFPDVAVELDHVSTDELRRRLEELDPVAASRVPDGNRRRLIRALEVTIGSGRPFSSHGPGMDSFGDTPFVLAGLTVSRDAMRTRIAARYDSQMAEGFLEEVRDLSARPGGLSRTAAEALGYRELLAHLRGELELSQALDLAVQHTRRFAVRQERWFRRDPRIRWFDAPGDAAEIDDLWSELAPGPGGRATTVERS